MIQKIINYTIILLLSFYAITVNFKQNGTCSKSIAWDAFGYYTYLPITFLDYDIALQDFDKIDLSTNNYIYITHLQLLLKE